jgi:hypothetical protein
MARRTVRAESGLEIVIPTMGWEQIGGDMDPSTNGGVIATADGHSIKLIEIQPVRASLPDMDAKEVGFPFWTKEAYFDADDLDPSNEDVDSALNSIGMSLETLEADFTPTQRAMVIAEALLGWGRYDEGPAGWSGDIDIPEKVKWMSGKIAGPEYLADEDDQFLNDILLSDLDIDYESYSPDKIGPDKIEPTSGLKVVTRGHTVEITEWTDIEDATGEEQPEGEKISKRYADVELDELLDPNGKHRGAYSRDSRNVSLMELGQMDDEDREKAIVAAAIAYLAYFGGEEEFVDEIGD